MDETQWNSKYMNSSNESPFGYSDKTIRSKLKEEKDLEETMIKYRYLIVLCGVYGSGRLNQFLAHSGAVIMLQESDYLYHYSSFFKPWVHYGKLRSLFCALYRIMILCI